MNDRVFIEKREVSSYPRDDKGYSPGYKYPEYPFSEISDSPNYIYDMVRSSLIGLGLDKKNVGTQGWNPLGEIIKPGDNVLIKPNLVSHRNGSGQGLDCMVTHPAVLRAVIDYVLIAMKESGKLTVGDAPVQSCDFHKLMVNHGYEQLMQFYKKNGIELNICDFRHVVNENGKQTEVYGNEGVCVNIGAESAFYDLNETAQKRLRVTNYIPSETYEHHHGEKHEYSITKELIAADVIINMPKPKCHRKAGITGALKNMIGINSEKAWLPHHRQGAVEKGGDEYPENSLIKRSLSQTNEKIDVSIKEGNTRKTKMLKKYLLLTNMVHRLRYGKESKQEGSWFGNDTIWRTISDVNKAVFYADKRGIIQKSVQRKMFIVADMIQVGEKEGPLAPSPKEMGIIMCGFSPKAMDCVIAKLMGFRTEQLPSIHSVQYDTRQFSKGSVTVLSNKPEWNHKNPDTMESDRDFHCIPPAGWKEYLQK